ncbi:MAG: protein kinase [Vicinamibacterales bacterium]
MARRRPDRRRAGPWGSALTIAAGTRLGHYEIVSPIGSGGMGEVYLAHDSQLDRKVALKILPGEVASDPDRMRRFVQEAKAASALNHPHIVTIHEIDTGGAVPFIATEFIDGETLRARIGAGLPLTDTLEIVIQACGALSASHAAGILHRDIKPENIMVRRDGFVKLVDFGLAKLTAVDSADGSLETRTTLRTDPGTIMGTATYMSPEQARGLDLDARTDIFSLGVVLYELVAGCLPFEGSTGSAVMASMLGGKDPQPLARYSRDAPAELERIVSKTLRKNRDERYQTIRDMLLDLKSLKQELEFQRHLDRSVHSPQTRRLSDAQGLTAQPATESAADQARGAPDTAGRRRLRLGAAVAALLIVAAGSGSYLYRMRARSGAITSVAVMPFINASGSGDAEYLSDGLTESLITSLSQIHGLSVKARSSVFRYKGKDASPAQVARELGVQAILNGRVVQRGDDLALHIELVDVASETALWSDDYSRRMTNVASLPGEIAQDVASKLRLTLSGDDQQKVAKNYTGNAEAYQAYLKGRFNVARATESGLRTSIDYFNQAIAIDPDYALAWAGLADAYWGDSDIHVAPQVVMPKAKQAALRAIAIDDSLAEAHAALAIALTAYDWNWPDAEKEFTRAVNLNPQYATAHAHFSWYLSLMARTDEAMAKGRRAIEIDPLSTEFNYSLGLVLFRARRTDEAVRQFRQTLALDPSDWITLTNLGWALIGQRRFPEAIVELNLARQIDVNHYVLAALGQAYALSGKRSDALATIDLMKEWSLRQYVSPHSIALVYAGLGENDLAFEWLDKGIEMRSEHIGWLKVDPRLDSLRSDPRFAALVRRVGL